MTSDVLLRQLAAVVQAQHPLAYCCACLAQRLGVDEGKIRDNSQILLIRERRRFVVARRRCAGCRQEDEMPVFVKGEREG